MADKFPSLDGVDAEIDPVEADGEFKSDFLSREKELIGDEFQTEQDNEVLQGDDEEIANFEENFPEVNHNEPVAADEANDEEFEGFSASAEPTKKNLGESEHIAQWKERRDMEIEEREKANSKKKEDIVAKAQQTIDDFYENYNIKKDEHKKEILDEQEAFLEKRDGFLKSGTLWDRVNELVDEVGPVPTDETRDKTRFKELLHKLKGKENVPGAGGY